MEDKIKRQREIEKVPDTVMRFMSNNKICWGEIYNEDLTLENLFQKMIDLENGLKDIIFQLENRIELLEKEKSVNIAKKGIDKYRDALIDLS